jgi:EAL domain-containing protein (putative c-di-GMP-specific phosphodiesterase class I)
MNCVASAYGLRWTTLVPVSLRWATCEASRSTRSRSTKSFVRALTTRADAMAIVRAVTGLGKSLGIATAAEGVETAEQVSVLKTEGCTEVQGFHYAAPRPAREVTAMLSRKGLRLVAG